MSFVVGAALTILIAFVAVLWPMRKAAQIVGAERTGYGTVIQALALSVVLAVVAGVLLALTGSRGLMSGIGGIVLVSAAMVFLYAKVFGTGMLGGFLIMLIANVISFLVALAAGALFGIGGLMLGGGSAGEQLRPAVDALCACGADEACQEEKSQAVGMAVLGLSATPGGLDAKREAEVRAEMERAQACLGGEAGALPGVPGSSSGTRPGSPSGGAAAGGGSAGGGSADPRPRSDEAAAPEAPRKPPRREAAPQHFTWVWQDTSVDELPALLGEVLRFELHDGREREGILLSVTAGSANLQSRQSRGLSYAVDLGAVKSVKVYTRVLQ